MTNYTIQVLNQSRSEKSYALFMQTPQVVANGGAPQVYTNAWATFGAVTNGGFDRITFDESTYAYWSEPPAGPMLSGGVMPVNPETRDTVAFSGGSPTGFVTVTSPGTAQAGSFSIVTSTDFTPANGYLLGVAGVSNSPIPTPSATFEALPNEIYNITPVNKFYVAEGAYTPGQVIDVAAAGATAAIDFNGRPQTTATIVQQPDGSFSLTYE